MRILSHLQVIVIMQCVCLWVLPSGATFESTLKHCSMNLFTIQGFWHSEFTEGSSCTINKNKKEKLYHPFGAYWHQGHIGTLQMVSEQRVQRSDPMDSSTHRYVVNYVFWLWDIVIHAVKEILLNSLHGFQSIMCNTWS